MKKGAADFLDAAVVEIDRFGDEIGGANLKWSEELKKMAEAKYLEAFEEVESDETEAAAPIADPPDMPL
jgi:hypothetical protein